MSAFSGSFYFSGFKVSLSASRVFFFFLSLNLFLPDFLDDGLGDFRLLGLDFRDQLGFGLENELLLFSFSLGGGYFLEEWVWLGGLDRNIDLGREWRFWLVLIFVLGVIL